MATDVVGEILTGRGMTAIRVRMKLFGFRKAHSVTQRHSMVQTGHGETGNRHFQDVSENEGDTARMREVLCD